MLNEIVCMFIASSAGAPMEQVLRVDVLENVGIVGDRYGMGTGFWKKKPELRPISLIARNAIAIASVGREFPFLPIDTRRNLLVSLGFEELNALLGREFKIGEIPVRGVELCTPCIRPSELSGKLGFAEAFKNMGGLRVTPLSDGVLEIGDLLTGF